MVPDLKESAIAMSQAESNKLFVTTLSRKTGEKMAFRWHDFFDNYI